jgi:hypothetical protein
MVLEWFCFLGIILRRLFSPTVGLLRLFFMDFLPALEYAIVLMSIRMGFFSTRPVHIRKDILQGGFGGDYRKRSTAPVAGASLHSLVAFHFKVMVRGDGDVPFLWYAKMVNERWVVSCRMRT